MGKFLDFIRQTWKESREWDGHSTTELPPPEPPARPVEHVRTSDDTLTNDEYSKTRQREIEALESRYDLKTVAGINAIPVPKNREAPQGFMPSVTGKIEYYLSLLASQYQREGESELALACMKKANELMPMSSTVYNRDTYMRLPRYLRKLRRFDEARVEEEHLERLLITMADKMSDAAEARLEQSAEIFGTDLVELPYSRACCSECAKYRNRVYSRHGRDKRFPVLPKYKCQSVHGCLAGAFPFIYGVNTLYNKHTLDEVDAIKHSNRPFIDDRDSQEVADYEKYEVEFAYERTSDVCRDDFDWLWEFMPEICPKSFSAYMRMRNARTANYEKIVEAAAEKGKPLT